MGSDGVFSAPSGGAAHLFFFRPAFWVLYAAMGMVKRNLGTKLKVGSG